MFFPIQINPLSFFTSVLASICRLEALLNPSSSNSWLVGYLLGMYVLSIWMLHRQWNYFPLTTWKFSILSYNKLFAVTKSVEVFLEDFQIRCWPWTNDCKGRVTVSSSFSLPDKTMLVMLHQRNSSRPLRLSESQGTLFKFGPNLSKFQGKKW